jgi:hypothetical protein
MKPPAAAFPCCSAHDLFAPLAQHARSILRSLADEVYWFRWQDTFCSDATIRVARLGDQAEFARCHRSSHYGKVRQCRGSLSPSDWTLIEDAVIAAEFWMLDESGGDHGLDGANWCIARRRRRDYHLVARWGPNGPLWDFGRLLFDLAGLGDVRL